MSVYPLRQKLSEQRIIGTFIGIDAPNVVETMGRIGFDYLVVDAEHGPLGIRSIGDLLRSAALVGAPTLVRVPETGPYIGRVLDAGAAGVLVPRIETADDAVDAVARARYAPEGYRGLGPGRGGYAGGDIPSHLRRANESVVVAIQIETLLGLKNADAILAVPGVDAVVVGPADLAASLGVPFGSTEHQAAVDRIIDAGLVHGVAPGAFCFTEDDAKRLAARGARMLIVGGDSLYMSNAAKATWAALSELSVPVTVDEVAR